MPTLSGDPVVYLNGLFIPRREAKLDIEDRGALFADGVYEVVRYYGGRALALSEHVERLRSSLAAIEMPEPPELGRIAALSDELVRRQRLPDAKVYWQVTRGSAPREHAFPQGTRPTVLLTASLAEALPRESAVKSVRAILAEDQRWAQCRIKSLMLLPNVLAKNRALAAGADEAILHRDGRVTEGTSTSLFAVRGGEVWTHPADQWILDGITRAIVLSLARRAGLSVREQAVTTAELAEADEVFLCGTTTHVAGVVSLDGLAVGTRGVGPVTTKLGRMLHEHIWAACIAGPRPLASVA